MKLNLNIEFTCEEALLPRTKGEKLEVLQQKIASVRPFGIYPSGETEVVKTGYLYPSTSIVRISQLMEGRWLDFLHAARAGHLKPFDS